METYDIDITLDNGKYRVKAEKGMRKFYAERHGEFWQDLTGNNLVYYLCQEIVSNLKKETEKRDTYLKDKNGQKIYEGDHLLSYSSQKENLATKKMCNNESYCIRKVIITKDGVKGQIIKQENYYFDDKFPLRSIFRPYNYAVIYKGRVNTLNMEKAKVTYEES